MQTDVAREVLAGTPIPVCLSFDVDVDESWRFSEPGGAELRNLTQLSSARYGITRGLPRLLPLLAELRAEITFFVPGAVADAYPTVIADMAAAGHEIGHHGYHHFVPGRISDAAQAEEFHRGTEAIARVTGSPPHGYRAPAWQMTAATFVLLTENGILYDSSMMGDDRPYVETMAGRELIELPVHWWLDDVPHFGPVDGDMGPLRDPRGVYEIWWIEVESAIAERRATSFCFHPEVTGRPWLFASFEQFVRRLAADPRVELTRCVDVARAFAAERGAGS